MAGKEIIRPVRFVFTLIFVFDNYLNHERQFHFVYETVQPACIVFTLNTYMTWPNWLPAFLQSSRLSSNTIYIYHHCSFCNSTTYIAVIMKKRVTIPAGMKSDVMFVVDNSANVARRQRNQRSVFSDDCGIWISKALVTTKTAFVIGEDGHLIFTRIDDNKACVPRARVGVLSSRNHLLIS